MADHARMTSGVAGAAGATTMRSRHGILPRATALLKNGYFWPLAVMTSLAAGLCYTPEATARIGLSPPATAILAAYSVPAYRLLFLVSSAIAAWRFGFKGGSIVCAIVGPIIILHVAVGIPNHDAWTDLAVLAIGFLFAGIAGRQGQMQRTLQKTAGELQHKSAMMAKEIAERKQSEESLLLKTALLEAQSETTIDGILAVGKDREVLLSNRRLQEMWRIPAGLLNGKMSELIFRHIISQTKDPGSSESQAEYLCGRREEKGRGELALADGRVFDVFSSPLVDSAGVHRGRIWYFRDVTDRKEMEQRLIVTDRLASIGELVSGVAHELNNPLTGVIGFAELMMQKDITDDVKEDLTIITTEAHRAVRIAKDLLAFARKHGPIRQVSQMNSIIEDVLRLRSHDHKVNNIQVVRCLAPDLPEIMADYHQLQQVFFNIVVNAEYSMAEAHGQGTLTITTESADSVVRAAFADDGLGIPRQNIGRLFDPFFTTKPAGKGTGLGLSICHGIVSEHGGRIYARSEPGEGATFVIELPLEQPSQ